MQLDTDVHVFNQYNVLRPKVRAPQHAHAPQNVRCYVPSRGCLGTVRIKVIANKVVTHQPIDAEISRELRA